MKTSLVILAVGAAAAVIATAISISRRTDIDPIDPASEKRKLVRAVSRTNPLRTTQTEHPEPERVSRHRQLHI